MYSSPQNGSKSLHTVAVLEESKHLTGQASSTSLVVTSTTNKHHILPILQARPVFQKKENAIHQVNPYLLLANVFGFPNTYLLIVIYLVINVTQFLNNWAQLRNVYNVDTIYGTQNQNIFPSECTQNHDLNLSQHLIFLSTDRDFTFLEQMI